MQFNTHGFRAIIPLLFLSLTLTCLAQDNYMSLSFGSSIPLGNFQQQSDVFKHGYAKAGFMAEYSGTIYLYKGIGLAGNFKFTDNTINKEALNANITPLLDNESSVSVDIAKWNTLSLTSGPQYTLGSKSLNVDFYFLLGVYVIQSPRITFTKLINNFEFRSPFAYRGYHFGFDSGVNLRLYISKRTGVRLFVAYQHSSIKETLLGDLALLNPEFSKDYKLNTDLINTGIGIIYRL